MALTKVGNMFIKSLLAPIADSFLSVTSDNYIYRKTPNKRPLPINTPPGSPSTQTPILDLFFFLRF